MKSVKIIYPRGTFAAHTYTYIHFIKISYEILICEYMFPTSIPSRLLSRTFSLQSYITHRGLLRICPKSTQFLSSPLWVIDYCSEKVRDNLFDVNRIGTKVGNICSHINISYVILIKCIHVYVCAANVLRVYIIFPTSTPILLTSRR